jgi:hypothetical protein
MICSQFQHPRSGVFSCLKFFYHPPLHLSLLVAGDTDGLAYFFNLKTMKLISILNVIDQTCISSAAQNLDLSKIKVPIPKTPQGLLTVGVDEVFSSSSDSSSSKLIFFAQSRSMYLYTFDLLKDVLKISSEEVDSDEEEKEEENESIQIPTIAIIGPFLNYSFAPILCLNQKRLNSQENVLIFLCPTEVMLATATENAKSDSAGITNGALKYCVIGANKSLGSQKDFDIISRGTGDFSFVSNSSAMTMKLGQIMTMETAKAQNENQSEHFFCAASFESGDVCLFKISLIDFITLPLVRNEEEEEEEIHQNPFDLNFFDTRIKMEILARVRVASEPVMSLCLILNRQEQEQQQSAFSVKLFCGSAEGNLICLAFDEKVRKQENDENNDQQELIHYFELSSTTSKSLSVSSSSSGAGGGGVGNIIQIRQDQYQKFSVCLECFLWNGERKRILVVNNDSDQKIEMSLVNSPLQNIEGETHSKAAVSSVVASFDSKIMQHVTSISRDANVRKMGRSEGNKAKGTMIAIAKKSGEVFLTPLF